MGCPDDDTLIALVEHALSPRAFADLEVHIDRCATCRVTVGHLARFEDRSGRGGGRRGTRSRS